MNLLLFEHAGIYFVSSILRGFVKFLRMILIIQFAYKHIITIMKYFDRTSNSLGICHGTDANRNWGYQWNTGGSSGNGCSDTYHGPEAFSEVENRYAILK